jgi:hypothetical protein
MTRPSARRGTFVIILLELLGHLRQLPNGKDGQFQLTQAIFAGGAFHDEASSNVAHAFEIANLTLQIAKCLSEAPVAVVIERAIGAATMSADDNTVCTALPASHRVGCSEQIAICLAIAGQQAQPLPRGPSR